MSPWLAPKVCAAAGCGVLVAVGQGGRCAAHRRDPERGRATPAQRGYGVTWRKLRPAILERDGYTCTVRGCGQPASDVDHRVPKHQGGSDDPDNLMSLCRRHHGQKTGRERQALSMRARP